MRLSILEQSREKQRELDRQLEAMAAARAARYAEQDRVSYVIHTDRSRDSKLIGK